MIDTVTVAAALLLVVSGTAKLRHPTPAGALITRLLGRRVRTRAARRLARAIGLGELAVGVAVLATGSRPALALLAGTYLLFAGVAVTALRTGGARTSCGCFGNAAGPLGPAHLVLDVVAAAAGLAAVADPPGALGGLLHGSGVPATTAGAQAVLLAGLGYLAVTSLPALLAARRALTAPPAPAPDRSVR